MCIFYLTRCQGAGQSLCASWDSHLWSIKLLMVLHPWQIPGLSGLKTCSTLKSVRLYCIVVLICIFLLNRELVIFSCAFWPFVFSFLWNGHSYILLIFLLGCVYFILFFRNFKIMSSDIILLWGQCVEMSSAHLWLIFKQCLCCLHCKEVLNFNICISLYVWVFFKNSFSNLRP